MKLNFSEQEKLIRESLSGVEKGTQIIVLTNPLPGSNKPYHIIEGSFQDYKRVDPQYSRNKSLYLLQERGSKAVTLTINETLVKSIRMTQNTVDKLLN